MKLENSKKLKKKKTNVFPPFRKWEYVVVLRSEEIWNNMDLGERKDRIISGRRRFFGRMSKQISRVQGVSLLDGGSGTPLSPLSRLLG